MGSISRRLTVLGVVALVILGGCSGDDVADEARDEPAGTTIAADEGGDAGGDGDGDGGDPPADMTSSEICDTLTADTVSAALGITVDSAEPVEGGTPQCSYSFTTEEGVISNVTVAVQRSEADLGGLTGTEALEYIVDVNRSIAGGGEYTEHPVTFGNQGVVLSSTEADGLHLGVVEVDGRIITTVLSVSGGDSIDAVAFTEIVGGILEP